MLLNLTLARSFLTSKVTYLTPLLLNPVNYLSTMSHPLPAAELPPSALPEQGPPKIHLYTVGTPNGYKASIILEELRAAYPAKALNELSYDYVPINFANLDQKSPAFLKINPNGRIPAIVDDNAGGKNVWETGSILLYLVNLYDTEHKLSFSDPANAADVVSWMFFANSGIGPMQGQANVFMRNKLKIPFGVKRYVEETERLYSVLEDGLKAGGGWLVGGKYSVADINAYTWVSTYGTLGIDMAKYPHVLDWLARISARKGVKAGLKVPKQRQLTDNEAAMKNRETVQKFIEEANKQLEEAQ